MKRVCVTGATGFVGSHCIRKLLDEGCDVTALVRSRSSLPFPEDSPIRVVTGSLADSGALRRAFEGCDTVIHTAGKVSFWSRDAEELFGVNVTGVNNVVTACLDAGVGRCVHVSSVAALGYRTDGGLIDESTAYNWGTRNAYRYSKYLGEIEILKGVEKGLSAVLVNPSIIIGAGDIHRHGGSILSTMKLFPLPVYPRGGINCVAVNDVVDGILAAARRGRTGERYILGGENMTHGEMFAMAARIVGRRPPSMAAPGWMIPLTASFSEFLSKITGRRPFFPRDMAEGSGLTCWYSVQKAAVELGYHPHSVEDAMREAFAWYRKTGMV